MMRLYFDSVADAQARYPQFSPVHEKKSHEQNGHIYTKIGVVTESRDRLWQAARIIQAVALSALALLIIPLFVPAYRKQTIKLWIDGTSGMEKFSLYAIDKPAEIQKAIQSVRKNSRVFETLAPEMR